MMPTVDLDQWSPWAVDRFQTMPKHEPEIRRAKAKRYVESCNNQVHKAPWTTGRTRTSTVGGLYQALELAELAHKAHGLPYKPNLRECDPRRFTWVYSDAAENFVKVRDDATGKLADWRWFNP
jgi:hypothetical protein